MNLLASNYMSVDFDYLMNHAEVKQEIELLQEWIEQLQNNQM
ncbi:hypothetical protein [Lentibacillus sp.]|nr:hypothetical protein [Lentibacillus sp.]HLS07713.1 hypothetical protein [Lentibacillus sp.]